MGRHREEFRFDRSLRALLGGTRKELEEQITSGFPFLPAGCHMELDRVASQIVLDNVRRTVPCRRAERLAELRALAASAATVSLETFMDATGLELEEVYANDDSWSDLCQDACLEVQTAGHGERLLRRACGRLVHVGDRKRIDGYRQMLENMGSLDVATLPSWQLQMLRMLVGSVVNSVANSRTTLAEGIALLAGHPQVRIEILAAFGIGTTARVARWQSGDYWAEKTKADLLAFTLDKTSGSFSPTTRYKDYAISRDLIHWESQSVTRAESSTGRRHRNHAALGSSIMLFARGRSDDRAFYFLGPATYVKHESELPMAITWRLHHPLPGDLFAAFAAAVA